MGDNTECGVAHPRLLSVTCTQPEGHEWEHVSIDYPMAGQWAGGAE
jgi:hypothetical protein